MSPTEQVIAKFVADDILRESGRSAIDVDQALVAEGILDSLGLQQLVAYLERTFDIELEDDHLVLENFETVGAIARLVDSIRG